MNERAVNTCDIGLRRTRIPFFGQLSDHVFFYTQVARTILTSWAKSGKVDSGKVLVIDYNLHNQTGNRCRAHAALRKGHVSGLRQHHSGLRTPAFLF
jgi:hypothetical protein